jgi:hypothetical protein
MVNSEVSARVKTRSLIHNTETMLGRVVGSAPLARYVRRLLMAQLHNGEQLLGAMEGGEDYTSEYARLELSVRAGVLAFHLYRLGGLYD